MSGKGKKLGVVGLVLGALLLVQTACGAPAAGADSAVAPADGDNQGQRTINVSGSGTAAARPDELVLRLGVDTMAETAREAVSENSQQMAAVIDALREAGIPDESIQTQTVRLSAQYETVRTEFGPATQRELVGYTATNVVEARTTDLDAVGQLLDEAVEAGANRIEGLRFELSDPRELLEQAREGAWQDAERKAQQLAGLAGIELAEVLTIEEATMAPRPMARLAAEVADVAVPIEPGAESVQVDLQVTWAVR